MLLHKLEAEVYKSNSEHSWEMHITNRLQKTSAQKSTIFKSIFQFLRYKHVFGWNSFNWPYAVWMVGLWNISWSSRSLKCENSPAILQFLMFPFLNVGINKSFAVCNILCVFFPPMDFSGYITFSPSEKNASILNKFQLSALLLTNFGTPCGKPQTEILMWSVL